MINKFSEKLLVENEINEDSIIELIHLNNDFDKNLNLALELAQDKINKDNISEVEKNKKKAIVKNNIKHSLLLHFIYESRLKSQEQNVDIKKYLEVMEIGISKGVKKANFILYITFISMLIEYVSIKYLYIINSCKIINIIIIGFLFLATLLFAYMPTNHIAIKLKAKRNLVREAKKEIEKNNI